MATEAGTPDVVLDMKGHVEDVSLTTGQFEKTVNEDSCVELKCESQTDEISETHKVVSENKQVSDSTKVEIIDNVVGNFGNLEDGSFLTAPSGPIVCKEEASKPEHCLVDELSPSEIEILKKAKNLEKGQEFGVSQETTRECEIVEEKNQELDLDERNHSTGMSLQVTEAGEPKFEVDGEEMKDKINLDHSASAILNQQDSGNEESAEKETKDSTKDESEKMEECQPQLISKDVPIILEEYTEEREFKGIDLVTEKKGSEVTYSSENIGMEDEKDHIMHDSTGDASISTIAVSQEDQSNKTGEHMKDKLDRILAADEVGERDAEITEEKLKEVPGTSCQEINQTDNETSKQEKDEYPFEDELQDKSSSVTLFDAKAEDISSQEFLKEYSEIKSDYIAKESQIEVTKPTDVLEATVRVSSTEQDIHCLSKKEEDIHENREELNITEAAIEEAQDTERSNLVATDGFHSTIEVVQEEKITELDSRKHEAAAEEAQEAEVSSPVVVKDSSTATIASVIEEGETKNIEEIFEKKEKEEESDPTSETKENEISNEEIMNTSSIHSDNKIQSTVAECPINEADNSHVTCFLVEQAEVQEVNIDEANIDSHEKDDKSNESSKTEEKPDEDNSQNTFKGTVPTKTELEISESTEKSEEDCGLSSKGSLENKAAKEDIEEEVKKEAEIAEIDPQEFTTKSHEAEEGLMLDDIQVHDTVRDMTDNPSIQAEIPKDEALTSRVEDESQKPKGKGNSDQEQIVEDVKFSLPEPIQGETSENNQGTVKDAEELNDKEYPTEIIKEGHETAFSPKNVQETYKDNENENEEDMSKGEVVEEIERTGTGESNPCETKKNIEIFADAPSVKEEGTDLDPIEAVIKEEKVEGTFSTNVLNDNDSNEVKESERPLELASKSEEYQQQAVQKDEPEEKFESLQQVTPDEIETEPSSENARNITCLEIPKELETSGAGESIPCKTNEDVEEFVVASSVKQVDEELDPVDTLKEETKNDDSLSTKAVEEDEDSKVITTDRSIDLATKCETHQQHALQEDETREKYAELLLATPEETETELACEDAEKFVVALPMKQEDQHEVDKELDPVDDLKEETKDDDSLSTKAVEEDEDHKIMTTGRSTNITSTCETDQQHAQQKDEPREELAELLLATPEETETELASDDTEKFVIASPGQYEVDKKQALVNTLKVETKVDDSFSTKEVEEDEHSKIIISDRSTDTASKGDTNPQHPLQKEEPREKCEDLLLVTPDETETEPASKDAEKLVVASSVEQEDHHEVDKGLDPLETLKEETKGDDSLSTKAVDKHENHEIISTDRSTDIASKGETDQHTLQFDEPSEKLEDLLLVTPEEIKTESACEATTNDIYMERGGIIQNHEEISKTETEGETTEKTDGTHDTEKEVLETTSAGQETRELALRELDGDEDLYSKITEIETVENTEESQVITRVETTSPTIERKEQNLDKQSVAELSSLSLEEEIVEESEKKDAILELQEQNKVIELVEEIKPESLEYIVKPNEDSEATETPEEEIHIEEKSMNEAAVELDNKKEILCHDIILEEKGLASRVDNDVPKEEGLDNIETGVIPDIACSITGLEFEAIQNLEETSETEKKVEEAKNLDSTNDPEKEISEELETAGASESFPCKTNEDVEGFAGTSLVNIEDQKAIYKELDPVDALREENKVEDTCSTKVAEVDVENNVTTTERGIEVSLTSEVDKQQAMQKDKPVEKLETLLNEMPEESETQPASEGVTSVTCTEGGGVIEDLKETSETENREEKESTDNAIDSEHEVLETPSGGQKTNEQVSRELDNAEDLHPKLIDIKIAEETKESQVITEVETTPPSIEINEQILDEQRTAGLSSLSLVEKMVEESSKDIHNDEDMCLELKEQNEVTDLVEYIKPESLEDSAKPKDIDTSKTTEITIEEKLAGENSQEKEPAERGFDSVSTGILSDETSLKEVEPDNKEKDKFRNHDHAIEEERLENSVDIKAQPDSISPEILHEEAEPDNREQGISYNDVPKEENSIETSVQSDSVSIGTVSEETSLKEGLDDEEVKSYHIAHSTTFASEETSLQEISLDNSEQVRACEIVAPEENSLPINVDLDVQDEPISTKIMNEEASIKDGEPNMEKDVKGFDIASEDRGSITVVTREVQSVLEIESEDSCLREIKQDQEEQVNGSSSALDENSLPRNVNIDVQDDSISTKIVNERTSLKEDEPSTKEKEGVKSFDIAPEEKCLVTAVTSEVQSVSVSAEVETEESCLKEAKEEHKEQVNDSNAALEENNLPRNVDVDVQDDSMSAKIVNEGTNLNEDEPIMEEDIKSFDIVPKEKCLVTAVTSELQSVPVSAEIETEEFCLKEATQEHEEQVIGSNAAVEKNCPPNNVDLDVLYDSAETKIVNEGTSLKEDKPIMEEDVKSFDIVPEEKCLVTAVTSEVQYVFVSAEIEIEESCLKEATEEHKEHVNGSNAVVEKNSPPNNVDQDVQDDSVATKILNEGTSFREDKPFMEEDVKSFDIAPEEKCLVTAVTNDVQFVSVSAEIESDDSCMKEAIQEKEEQVNDSITALEENSPSNSVDRDVQDDSVSTKIVTERTSLKEDKPNAEEDVKSFDIASEEKCLVTTVTSEVQFVSVSAEIESEESYLKKATQEYEEQVNGSNAALKDNFPPSNVDLDVQEDSDATKIVKEGTSLKEDEPIMEEDVKSFVIVPEEKCPVTIVTSEVQSIFVSANIEKEESCLKEATEEHKEQVDGSNAAVEEISPPNNVDLDVQDDSVATKIMKEELILIEVEPDKEEHVESLNNASEDIGLVTSVDAKVQSNSGLVRTESKETCLKEANQDHDEQDNNSIISLEEKDLANNVDIDVQSNSVSTAIMKEYTSLEDAKPDNEEEVVNHDIGSKEKDPENSKDIEVQSDFVSAGLESEVTYLMEVKQDHEKNVNSSNIASEEKDLTESVDIDLQHDFVSTQIMNQETSVKESEPEDKELDKSIDITPKDMVPVSNVDLDVVSGGIEIESVESFDVAHKDEGLEIEEMRLKEVDQDDKGQVNNFDVTPEQKGMASNVGGIVPKKEDSDLEEIKEKKIPTITGECVKKIEQEVEDVTPFEKPLDGLPKDNLQDSSTVPSKETEPVKTEANEKPEETTADKTECENVKLPITAPIREEGLLQKEDDYTLEPYDTEKEVANEDSQKQMDQELDITREITSDKINTTLEDVVISNREVSEVCHLETLKGKEQSVKIFNAEETGSSTESSLNREGVFTSLDLEANNTKNNELPINQNLEPGDLGEMLLYSSESVHKDQTEKTLTLTKKSETMGENSEDTKEISREVEPTLMVDDYVSETQSTIKIVTTEVHEEIDKVDKSEDTKEQIIDGKSTLKELHPEPNKDERVFKNLERDDPGEMLSYASESVHKGQIEETLALTKKSETTGENSEDTKEISREVEPTLMVDDYVSETQSTDKIITTEVHEEIDKADKSENTKEQIIDGKSTLKELHPEPNEDERAFKNLERDDLGEMLSYASESVHKGQIEETLTLTKKSETMRENSDDTKEISREVEPTLMVADYVSETQSTDKIITTEVQEGVDKDDKSENTKEQIIDGKSDLKEFQPEPNEDERVFKEKDPDPIVTEFLKATDSSENTSDVNSQAEENATKRDEMLVTTPPNEEKISKQINSLDACIALPEEKIEEEIKGVVDNGLDKNDTSTIEKLMEVTNMEEAQLVNASVKAFDNESKERNIELLKSECAIPDKVETMKLEERSFDLESLHSKQKGVETENIVEENLNVYEVEEAELESAIEDVNTIKPILDGGKLDKDNIKEYEMKNDQGPEEEISEEQLQAVSSTLLPEHQKHETETTIETNEDVITEADLRISDSNEKEAPLTIFLPKEENSVPEPREVVEETLGTDESVEDIKAAPETLLDYNQESTQVVREDEVASGISKEQVQEALSSALHSEEPEPKVTEAVEKTQDDNKRDLKILDNKETDSLATDGEEEAYLKEEFEDFKVDKVEEEIVETSRNVLVGDESITDRAIPDVISKNQLQKSLSEEQENDTTTTFKDADEENKNALSILDSEDIKDFRAPETGEETCLQEYPRGIEVSDSIVDVMGLDETEEKNKGASQIVHDTNLQSIEAVPDEKVMKCFDEIVEVHLVQQSSGILLPDEQKDGMASTTRAIEEESTKVLEVITKNDEETYSQNKSREPQISVSTVEVLDSDNTVEVTESTETESKEQSLNTEVISRKISTDQPLPVDKDELITDQVVPAGTSTEQLQIPSSCTLTPIEQKREAAAIVTNMEEDDEKLEDYGVEKTVEEICLDKEEPKKLQVSEFEPWVHAGDGIQGSLTEEPKKEGESLNKVPKIETRETEEGTGNAEPRRAVVEAPPLDIGEREMASDFISEGTQCHESLTTIENVEIFENHLKVATTDLTNIEYQHETNTEAEKDMTKVILEKEALTSIELSHEKESLSVEEAQSSHETCKEQSPMEADNIEITTAKITTGDKDDPQILLEPVEETSQRAESKDIKTRNETWVGDKEIKDEQYRKEKEAVDDSGEQKIGSESAVISLSELKQSSTEENAEVAEHLSKEKEPKSSKQVEHDQTHEEDDEEEEEEHEDEDHPDAPILVQASKDIDAKAARKKSQGIFSGVGSKVKHSISKVKKAITGKSSHSTKTQPSSG